MLRLVALVLALLVYYNNARITVVALDLALLVITNARISCAGFICLSLLIMPGLVALDLTVLVYYKC